MPAPDFTVEVTALVAANMTNAAGYNATDRTNVTAFLVSDIVTLVDPNQIIEDYTDPIYTALQAESTYNFGKAVGNFKVMIDFLCSETINTIVLPYYSGAGGLGVQVMYAKLNQIGVAAPTIDIVSPSNGLPFGEAPTTGYNGVGDYDLNWATATPFGTGAKVRISIGNILVSNWVEAYVAAPNQIIINTYVQTVAAAPGNVAGTASDGILLDTELKIEVYP